MKCVFLSYALLANPRVVHSSEILLLIPACSSFFKRGISVLLYPPVIIILRLSFKHFEKVKVELGIAIGIII